MKAEKKFKPKFRERKCKMCGELHRPNKLYKVYCPKCYRENEIDIRKKSCETQSKYWNFRASIQKIKVNEVIVECVLCGDLYVVEEKKALCEHICDKCQKHKRGKEYKEWVKVVLSRDNYVCVKCGSDEKIQAHHILSWRNFPDLRLDVTNGETLCYECHKETISYGGKRPERIDEEINAKK